MGVVEEHARTHVRPTSIHASSRNSRFFVKCLNYSTRLPVETTTEKIEFDRKKKKKEEATNGKKWVDEIHAHCAHSAPNGIKKRLNIISSSS